MLRFFFVFFYKSGNEEEEEKGLGEECRESLACKQHDSH